MCSLDIPQGDVMFHINGEWKSYASTDTFNLTEFKKLNDKYWHLPVGTHGVFRFKGKMRCFVILDDYLMELRGL